MNIIKFDTKSTSLIFCSDGGLPCLIYWGVRLSEQANLEQVIDLHRRQEAPASTKEDPPISLSPNYGEGFTGQVGLQVHRQGEAWAPVFELGEVKRREASLVFCSTDSYHGLALEHHFNFDIANDLFTCFTRLKNQHKRALSLDWCAAPCIPIAEKFANIMSFEGRWAKEFQGFMQSRGPGVYLRENRKGRTSHDSFPSIFLAANGYNITLITISL